MMAARTLRLASEEDAASDAELCRAFLGGSVPAFEALVRRHHLGVRALLARHARSPDEAADLTQRAFLKAFEAARRTFPSLSEDQAQGAFKAWLYRIALNLARNQARDERRWGRSPVEAIDAQAHAEPEGPARLERAQSAEALRLAARALPPRQRQVYVLRVEAGLSFAEVARALSITENNAKTHFHHAVKRLTRALKGSLP